jgi:hypothetical protein
MPERLVAGGRHQGLGNDQVAVAELLSFLFTAEGLLHARRRPGALG